MQYPTEPYEYFCFLNHTFDVAKAKQIIDNKRRPTVKTFNIADIEDFLPEEKANKNLTSNSDLFKIQIDKYYALTLPESVVNCHCIAATVKWKTDFVYIIIDGWHRIYRRKAVGKDTFKAFVLSRKDTEKIMI